MSFDIEEELKKLPDSPGVYIMHDASDEIIYVGKAKSLTKRVHQYFQPSHDEGLKKRQMVAHIDRFEYIVVDSELEALVLENNLIKEHRPKYNTLLRDDKTYPYIKVTLDERFPRVMFSRKVKKDGARYFGPFTSAEAVHETIDLVNKLFQLRTCSRKLPETIGKERPCLNYHMKQCSGVCLGTVSEEEYGVLVKKAIDFLNGNSRDEEKRLEKKMNEASAEMNFEQAAKYRDLLEAVRFCMNRQKITDTSEDDRDVIGLSHDDDDCVASVFFVRAGRLIGRDHFHMALNVISEDENESLTGHFLMQYYSGTPFIPREVFVREELPEIAAIEEWLTKKRGSRVRIVTPKRGAKEKLLELTEKNAGLILSKDRERIIREEGRTIGAAKEIADILGIPAIDRMEAFDISNTSGFLSVGSMVVFEKGKPKRSDYRKFRLKTVEGPDDYASMKEVLTRRFTHGLQEREESSSAGEDKKELSSFTKFPDVIMMDGGRGQVNIALSVLSELGLDIPVCGMVKDDRHRTRGLYYNNVELPIDRSSEGFKLITRLQDEAHRFAIEYHRSLRGKEQVHSFLDDIEGIGPARKKALMREFSGPEEMRGKTVEDFEAIPGMNKAAALNIYNYLHRNYTDDSGSGEGTMSKASEGSKEAE